MAIFVEQKHEGPVTQILNQYIKPMTKDALNNSSQQKNIRSQQLQNLHIYRIATHIVNGNRIYPTRLPILPNIHPLMHTFTY